MLIGVSFYMSKKEHLRRPWRKVTESKTGMASMVLLLFFVAIGLLDSVHFRSNNQQTNEVVSLLDSALIHLKNGVEKTYSAPFSAVLLNKELVLSKEGNSQWGHPRLKFGAAHIDNPDLEKPFDILKKCAIGLLKGLVIAGLLTVIYWKLFRRKKNIELPHIPSTGKVIGMTVLLLSVASCILIELSFYYHILGTDKVGEDVFYQTLKSIRTGLVIGTLTTLIMLPLAITLGILAGYFRGWVDDLIQYLYTTLNSIPGVLLIAASILMVQVYMANHEEIATSLEKRADIRLFFLCLILGVTSWTGLCRLLRAETLKLREMEYVQAAKSLGVKQFKILLIHILPNVMHIVLISIVLDFSSLVLAEAVLSYINIGVDPATYSWGNMINSARMEMAREPVVWWSLAAAFIFMFALVLAANLFADVVRNAFDPRRSERV